MNFSAIKLDSHAVEVVFTEDAVRFVLVDGREISAPLEWFPKLRDADDRKRNHWRLIGKGSGVHWPDLDEDISVSFLIHGRE
ncbi:MAG: hypothetical protein A3I12_04215 [Gammaproteobacteria bacterium RIFCSPLOWO2_02_FULL_38_11]|nr:MAG: hypothetical protein A2W47_01990 [Gammaproteobacteria bacterium RIFCSPHIGHO2_12_38_15]OGT67482.1 MAG: hypothetical protein A3I12_04215 [Gammaproteobacteria bacterium RIFCSPLOWO2_02_FULL_38_11]OGT76183.1 MAG: hypothetical protein A3G71_04655 [Gammaproteobacteria bacterium RIFCSPLOWO2_12_FULL_38_14]